MRRLVLLSSLAGAGLGIGLASSHAQYAYPPGGYRGIERDGVMTIAPDDDDQPTAALPRISLTVRSTGRKPGLATAVRPRRSGLSRRPHPNEARGYNPRERQAMPPAEPLPPPDRYGRPAYGAMPPYGEPYVPGADAPPPPPGYPPPGPYAVNPPADVLRPPQAIGAPTNLTTSCRPWRHRRAAAGRPAGSRKAQTACPAVQASGRPLSDQAAGRHHRHRYAEHVPLFREWRRALRSATASGLAGTASPGPAPRRSPAWRNGRTGKSAVGDDRAPALFAALHGGR